MDMFESQPGIHRHWNSACERFASAHNLVKLAAEVEISAQVLRNKLNPEQPHRLTVNDLLRLTDCTKDYSLVDGALAQLGRLPCVAGDEITSATNIPAQALKISAAAGELAGESVQLISGARLTKTRKDAIVARANKAVRDLMLFAYAIEERFHSVPVLSTTADLLTNSNLPGLM
ncbi:phage regulatory CII family protein [Hafnia paralvei]|uniref:phage regulatory CII family protein n=1 Tax=Hafnia paralvei TaxID=546367 RepID=UPI0020329685|nr:phage regulatory CII family protein [Hafnia paralvei]